MKKKNQDNLNDGRTAASSDAGGLYLVLVDDSREFNCALKKAAILAGKANSHVALLFVCEEQGFQPWGGIEDRVRKEQREEAEARLTEVAQYLYELNGEKPAFFIEEGSPREVLVRVLNGDHDIHMLVLGEGKGTSNPLIHYFVDMGVHEVGVPMLVVPDDVTETD